MIPNDSHETTRPPRMSDSEATRADKEAWRKEMIQGDINAPRAAGIDWTKEVCATCGAVLTGAWFCVGGYAFCNTNCEREHRPLRENLDLMRDTTDAVSGEKPKCGVPQYAGSNLCTLDGGHGGDHECQRGAMIHCWPKGTPNPAAPDSGKDAFEEWFVKRYPTAASDIAANNAFASSGRELRHDKREVWDAALESKPAPEGEAKVTWRVDVHKTLGPKPQRLPCESEAGANEVMSEVIAWQFTAGADKVKMETYETVVETIKKEA